MKPHECVEYDPVWLLDVFVPGRPAPQGSKSYMGRGQGGNVRMVESSKAVKPWRSDIRSYVIDAYRGPQIATAVAIELEFVMPRPSATPKRRTPPAIRRPDLDKLVRAVLDAIGSAGLWKDDSQVVCQIAAKRLAEVDEQTGCRIRVCIQ
jgi:crossover junction endodeoxyribonuclease RusA